MKGLALNRLMCRYPVINSAATNSARLVIRATAPILRRMEEILDIQYPLCTDPVFLSMFKGKHIAVVGNGPNIEGKGSEIDSHDVVIRFNFGTLPGHLNAEDTGVKTTVASIGAMQTIASKDVSHAVRNTVEGLLFNVGIGGDSRRPSFAVNRFLIRRRYRDSLARKGLLPPGLFKQLEDELNGSPPSTGYTTLMFLLRYADFASISIYGFNFTSNNRIVGSMGNVSHAFTLEQKNLMQEIEGKSNISFYSE